jgi:hypothetical protein
MMPDNQVRWLRPNVVEGVVRWPPCEGIVTDPLALRNRDEDDTDCSLSAKVDFRGRMLCKRHAAKLALQELCSEPF